MVSLSRAATLGEIAPASRALAWWLLGHGYSQHDAESIVVGVEVLGELASAVAAGLLGPADEAEATEAYIEALEPVDPDDESWGPLLPPELVETEEEPLEEWLDPHDGESYDDALPVPPPLSGGSPEADRAEEMRAWYRRNPIDRFNSERAD